MRVRLSALNIVTQAASRKTQNNTVGLYMILFLAGLHLTTGNVTAMYNDQLGRLLYTSHLDTILPPTTDSIRLGREWILHDKSCARVAPMLRLRMGL